MIRAKEEQVKMLESIDSNKVDHNALYQEWKKNPAAAHSTQPDYQTINQAQ